MEQRAALLPVLRAHMRPWCTHTPCCGPLGGPAFAASTQGDIRQSEQKGSQQLATKGHIWRL